MLSAQELSVALWGNVKVALPWLWTLVKSLAKPPLVIKLILLYVGYGIRYIQCCR